MHTFLEPFDALAILRPMLGLAWAVLLLAPGREALAVELTVLAAGATESTVRDMVGTFEKQSGHTVKLTYGAVGALRNAIVEPVFGQIKDGCGFRRFSFRGLAMVQAEWLLICLTHNLLKLFAAGRCLRAA